MNFAFYTPERLVNIVRTTFHLWHLDSYNCAWAILERFNAISPLSYPALFSLGLKFISRLHAPSPTSVNPPPYDAGAMPVPLNARNIHVSNSSANNSLHHFTTPDTSSSPIDSSMDFEGEI